MDIASISKVANRKKINNESEQLREKLSRQTSDIIKLKVAQDTAYWDLKEKYQQLEGNHEKLQQNMVEVQMQHEAISGQYQEELRLRPDTLNKIQTTRELATVLEQYSDRLKNTLSKCISDKNALTQAFKNSGALVKEMKIIQNNMDEVYKRNMAELGDKLKKETAHHSQLMELYRSSSKHDQEEISGLKTALTATRDVKEKIENELREEKSRVDKLKNEVENKERMINELQADMRRLIHEIDVREKKIMANVAKLESDNKLYLEKIQALETALTNQEQYTETVKSENNHLQDKITAAEDENERLKTLVLDNELVIKESAVKIEKLTTDVNDADSFRTHLEDIIQEQAKSVELYSVEVSTLKHQLTNLKTDKLQATSKLEDSSTMCQKLSEENLLLQEEVRRLGETVKECTKKAEDMEKSYEAKLKELTTTVETKETELTSKNLVVGRLMNDVMKEKEKLSRLEGQLEKIKTESKSKEEMIAMGEKANVLLTDKNKEKDRECSKQMSLILELRSEKERLQTEILELNKAINNIQKEVTGTTRRHRSPILQAEMDDNAVTLTPREAHNNKPPQKLCDSTMFTVPKSKEDPKKKTVMVYDFNSDRSTDDEYDFRGLMSRVESSHRSPLSPLPPLKRRAGTPVRAQGGLRSGDDIENERIQGKKFFKNKKERKMKSQS